MDEKIKLELNETLYEEICDNEAEVLTLGRKFFRACLDIGIKLDLFTAQNLFPSIQTR